MITGEPANYSRSSNYRNSDWNTPNRYDDNWRYRDEDGRDWWDKTKDEVSSWFGDDDAKRRRRMDEWREDHRGKGPKNYTRSQEKIKEDVSDKLSDNWMIDASDIEVEVTDTEVTLTGSVKNRQSKRLAEDIAEDVSGVTHVQNNLRMNSTTSSDNKTSTDYTTKKEKKWLAIIKTFF